MANEFRIKNGLIVDQGTSQITGSLLVSGSQTLTGSLNVSAGITGSLFGTSSNIQGGTVNYIPIWNAATSLSSSVLYQSASNVGIGTTTPSFRLDVSGSDAAINGVRVGRGAGNVSTNIAIGSQSLASNTTGDGNTAIGHTTLRLNTSGVYNTAVGASVLSQNTGNYNTAVGSVALASNTTGAGNVALGMTALNQNTTGLNNVAIGYDALTYVVASNNTAVGQGALRGTGGSSGANNTAVGYQSLYNNTSGQYSTAIGYSALSSNTAGAYNIALGLNSLYNNTTGTSNIAIGNNTAASNNGYFNVFIGNEAATNATTSEYSLVIGGYITPAGTDFNDNQTVSIAKHDTAAGSYYGSGAFPHFWAPETGYVGDGGTGVMITLESTVYSAFFMDYNVEDLNANMRAGTIKAIWKADGSSIKVTEETTDSIGTTSGIVISVTYSSGTIQVTIDNNNGYGAYYNLTSRLLIRPTILNF